MPLQSIHLMATNTLELSCKVTLEAHDSIKEAFSALRRVIAGFPLLKVKEKHSPVKEI